MTSLKTATPSYHLSSIHAPVTGTTLELEQVNDVVFSEKLVGVGIAIRPDAADELDILAPADGTIVNILIGNHAFFLKTDDGVELLVHYGLNSVKLNGEGFTRVAGIGQPVKRGDVVLRVDNRVLAQHQISTVTPVVVVSPELYDVKILTGGVSAGVSPIIHVHRR